MENFAEHVDHLTAYGHVTESIYYAMHFVSGVMDDIQTATSLTLL